MFLSNFIYSMDFFISSYPNSYAWGEIFIKYTDGFIRRGLVGSVLFLFSDIITPCFLWTSCAVILYAFFFIKVYNLFKENITYFFTIIFFFSPGMIAFMVKDKFLFGRKDLLFLLLIFMIMSLCTKIIKSQQISSFIWIKIIACYIISFLIHEITLFFSLLPAILVLAASSRKKLAVLMLTIMFGLSAFLAVRYQGTEAVRDAMLADWNSIINNFTYYGGMNFIGVPITHLIDANFAWFNSYKFRMSYTFTWLLTLAPILIFLYVYDFHNTSIRVIGKPLTWCSYLCALFPVITLNIFVCDFGRIISYSSIIFVTYAVLIINIYKSRYGSIKNKKFIDVLTFDNIYTLTFTIYYILGWTLPHYTPVAKSIFKTFIITG